MKSFLILAIVSFFCIHCSFTSKSNQNDQPVVSSRIFDSSEGCEIGECNQVPNGKCVSQEDHEELFEAEGSSGHQLYWTEFLGEVYCSPVNASSCACVVEKCRDVGCSQEGGHCYAQDQPNMDCKQNTGLCGPIPAPLGGPNFHIGDLADCFCCKPKIAEVHQCEDRGCSDVADGNGVCVNIEAEPHFMEKYDLTSTNRKNNELCVPHDGAHQDCCLCMVKSYSRPSPCEDDGCFEKGGQCINMKMADLTDAGIFPRNAVDINRELKEEDGTPLCGQTEIDRSNCCKCYQRLVPTATAPTNDNGDGIFVTEAPSPIDIDPAVNGEIGNPDVDGVVNVADGSTTTKTAHTLNACYDANPERCNTSRCKSGIYKHKYCRKTCGAC